MAQRIGGKAKFKKCVIALLLVFSMLISVMPSFNGSVPGKVNYYKNK